MAENMRKEKKSRTMVDAEPPRAASSDDDPEVRVRAKKRKAQDALGPRWSEKELEEFFKAYTDNKREKDWAKVAARCLQRTPEMVEALYNRNRTYLNNQSATEQGLVCLMTDYYFNLEASSGDEQGVSQNSRSSAQAPAEGGGAGGSGGGGASAVDDRMHALLHHVENERSHLGKGGAGDAPSAGHRDTGRAGTHTQDAGPQLAQRSPAGRRREAGARGGDARRPVATTQPPAASLHADKDMEEEGGVKEDGSRQGGQVVKRPRTRTPIATRKRTVSTRRGARAFTYLPDDGSRDDVNGDDHDHDREDSQVGGEDSRDGGGTEGGEDGASPSASWARSLARSNSHSLSAALLAAAEEGSLHDEDDVTGGRGGRQHLRTNGQGGHGGHGEDGRDLKSVWGGGGAAAVPTRARRPVGPSGMGSPTGGAAGGHVGPGRPPGGHVDGGKKELVSSRMAPWEKLGSSMAAKRQKLSRQLFSEKGSGSGLLDSLAAVAEDVLERGMGGASPPSPREAKWQPGRPRPPPLAPGAAKGPPRRKAQAGKVPAAPTSPSVPRRGAKPGAAPTSPRASPKQLVVRAGPKAHKLAPGAPNGATAIRSGPSKGDASAPGLSLDEQPKGGAGEEAGGWQESPQRKRSIPPKLRAKHKRAAEMERGEGGGHRGGMRRGAWRRGIRRVGRRRGPRRGMQGPGCAKTGTKAARPSRPRQVANAAAREARNPAWDAQTRLTHALSQKDFRNWCAREWFYPAIDAQWYLKNEFVDYLRHLELPNVTHLPRSVWGAIRGSLGRPRRFSQAFLDEERANLHMARESMRARLQQQQLGTGPREPYPLFVGQMVSVLRAGAREVAEGRIVAIRGTRVMVSLDRAGPQGEAVTEEVEDMDVMPTSSRAVAVRPGPSGAGREPPGPRTGPQHASDGGGGPGQTSSYFQIKANGSQESSLAVIENLQKSLSKKDELMAKLKKMNAEVEESKAIDPSGVVSETLRANNAGLLLELQKANREVEESLLTLRVRSKESSGGGSGSDAPGPSFSYRQSMRHSTLPSYIQTSGSGMAGSLVEAAVRAGDSSTWEELLVAAKQRARSLVASETAEMDRMRWMERPLVLPSAPHLLDRPGAIPVPAHFRPVPPPVPAAPSSVQAPGSAPAASSAVAAAASVGGGAGSGSTVEEGGLSSAAHVGSGAEAKQEEDGVDHTLASAPAGSAPASQGGAAATAGGPVGDAAGGEMVDEEEDDVDGGDEDDDDSPRMNDGMASHHMDKMRLADMIASCMATLLTIKNCSDNLLLAPEVASSLDQVMEWLRPHAPSNIHLFKEIEQLLITLKTQFLLNFESAVAI
eukprot:jgi/Mesvir1/27955/Mv20163-RA.1